MSSATDSEDIYGELAINAGEGTGAEWDILENWKDAIAAASAI